MQLNESGMALLKHYFSSSPVLRAYLFGSVARNEADDLSDVDILVDLDYSQRIGLKFIQMKLDLERLLNQKVDLVSSKGLSPYMSQKIDNEKQLIYAR
jgi:predicted nucleotidyltransferase